MGKPTPEKPIFDEHAKRWFRCQGYEAEIISGHYADVAAWHLERNEFAIVEVKAPNEKGAWLSPGRKDEVGLGNKSRDTVWGEVIPLIHEKNHKVAQLIALTVSHQLYTYWTLRRKHWAKFKEKIRNTSPHVRLSQGQPRLFTSFLVLPSDYESIAKHVMKVFDNITWSLISNDGMILVMQVRYPSG